ncbi:MAG: MBL fold metallo-hydrolase [Candidatus Omnitrophica bacterium]|nr:MBL fold metallo-hydrolase [Candidatus Omnitrophota bacterium]
MKSIRLVFITTVFLFLANICFAANCSKLHFINTGKGEAVLIQSGNENALIDTGGFLSGYRVVDYLKKNKIVSLKYLIVTHPHPDHFGGAFFVLPQIDIEKIFDNGQVLDNDDYTQESYGMLVRSKKNYLVLKKGDQLKLGGITLDVLWPQEAQGSSFNDNSLVLKLKACGVGILLTSDLGSQSEEQLLKEKSDLKSAVLKVGHHGYKNATSKAFLKIVSPEIAIISVGPTNRIEKAPSSETINLLKKRGIKIYRTDEDGEVIVDIDSKGKYSVSTQGKE